MSVINLAELRALAHADTRPQFTEVEVPQWPGKKIRLRRLTAVGLIDVIDLFAALPKDAEGKALATAEGLVEFYERLLADTVVDASNIPLFANKEDRELLRQHPGPLMFLGKASQEFNRELLSVEKTAKKKKGKKDPPETSPSTSAKS